MLKPGQCWSFTTTVHSLHDVCKVCLGLLENLFVFIFCVMLWFYATPCLNVIVVILCMILFFVLASICPVLDWVCGIFGKGRRVVSIWTCMLVNDQNLLNTLSSIKTLFPGKNAPNARFLSRHHICWMVPFSGWYRCLISAGVDKKFPGVTIANTSFASHV